jgi:hypothetical protein
MRNRRELLSAAEAILDGRPVNWDTLREQAATDDLRALVAQLEKLEKISRVHAPPAWPGAEDISSGVVIEDYHVRRFLDEDRVVARYEVTHEQRQHGEVLSLVKWEVDARDVLCAFTRWRPRLLELPSPPLLFLSTAGVTREGRVFFTGALPRDPPLLAYALEGPLPGTTRLALARRVIAAVAVAHRRGIPHGGLVPRCLRAPGASGEPQVLEFGVGTCLDIRRMEFHAARRHAEAPSYPRYLCPEQQTTETTSVDPRMDVYALATLIEDLLPDLAAGPTIGPLVRRAHDPDPKARPADADEMLAWLDRHVSGP